MSYMRGRYYLWRDDTRLHIWAADGYDGWDDSVWAAAPDQNREADGSRASGVSIPMEVIDELVVARIAQMIDEGLVASAIERAAAKHGRNFGCQLLASNAERLIGALQRIVLEAANDSEIY